MLSRMANNKPPMSAECCEFIKKLDKLQKFRLHTGNVNAYAELKMRRFKDSADELSACLNLQIQSAPKGGSEVQENGTLLLCDNAHITNYHRNDLTITMKVFLSKWDKEELKESVDCIKEQLSVEDIELLIIAFPDVDIIEGESDEKEVARWGAMVETMYPAIEELIASGQVCSYGVSDLSVLQMMVFEKFQHRPTVNHVRVDECCAVAPELSSYAKLNDVQLLTHNDPNPFPVREVFNTFCDIRQSSPVCCSMFTSTWAARYTVWVRCRSVMASKGYFVQFHKKRQD